MLAGNTLLDSSRQVKTPSTNGKKMALLLVKVAEERCQHSFSQVFTFFAPRLKSYGYKQSGSEVVAMEIVQETMACIWQKAHLFDMNKGAASTWIFTIARNIHYDILRRKLNRKEDVCGDDLWPVLCEQTPDPKEPDIDAELTLQKIQSVLSALPPKQKQVIEAIYLQGLSQQELAEQLEVPVGTVKSRVRLGLERLKELLKQDD
jgi:RNA polymerase sigma-70 factor (ECF subfamily)